MNQQVKPGSSVILTPKPDKNWKNSSKMTIKRSSIAASMAGSLLELLDFVGSLAPAPQE